MRLAVALFLVIMGLLMGFGVACADTLDRIVAVVNGDIILNSELQDQIRLLTKMTPELKTDDPVKHAQIEREILQQMVRDHLADAEIRRLKITVSARDLDDAVEGIKQDNHFTDAQLDYMIQQQGQTRAQFREALKKEIERTRLVERVLKSKTIVTQEQVDAYLNTDQAGFSEKRRLSIIFLPIPEGADARKMEEIDKLGKDLLKRLKGGADFAEIARTYSQGPAAQEGGDLGYVAVSELAPPIETATRGLKPGNTTDLIKSPSGYLIFKVVDVLVEKQTAIDASTREKARKRLLEMEMNRKFQEWVKDLESRAFIQISL
jgi:peptidyl-prolyl cis-trans isomerase SurA